VAREFGAFAEALQGGGSFGLKNKVIVSACQCSKMLERFTAKANRWLGGQLD
jgi:hypothetical protein